MNTAIEEEEDFAPVEAPFEEEQDRELTLNSTTLLAIFFGLVLVCGLCFGFGFTLGKRSGASNAASSAHDATIPSQPSEYRAKPSASAQEVAVAEPASSNASNDTSADAPGPEDASKSASTSDPEDSSRAPEAKPRTDQTAGIPKPVAEAPPAGRFMVQVAAVSNPADAEVLIGALTKRGYTVAARHEPTDALLHVQIGPLTTRADAIAMRQKLLSDGYNAILK